jgi:CheY-like chemotaxis protein
MLHTIHSGGSHLLTVINDILDFSKIESGKLDLDGRPFDLRLCVEDALELVAARAADKGIELAYEYLPGTPEGVIGDSGRVRQILTNYLSNAVKFTHRGEVVVTIGARPAGDRRHEVQVAVRDTGIGIPGDRLDRLFKSFSQVEASTARTFGGTGLGLAISRSLAEMMGGRVWVESEAGKGSTFFFTIEAEEVEAPARAAAGDPDGLRGRHLLVVDDNATNRHLLASVASSWGMLVRETEHPREALAWLDAGERFDLAVLDYLMPEMDGVALAREMEGRPAGKGLPVIIASSVGHPPPASQGFVACLTKPIRHSALHSALLGALDQRRLAEGQAGADRQAVSPQPRLAPAALSILLAEDNENNQKIALFQLDSLGYGADVVGDGAAVLRALEKKRYDVILMDVQMPGMDGLSATRAIVERWPRPARPHIIAVTANALIGDRELCLQAGMDDYLPKPIARQRLAQALAGVAAARGVKGQGPPRPEPTPAERRPDGRPTQIDAAMGKRWPLRVLVADDNEANRRLAGAQFASLGYTVDFVADGRQATDAVSSKPYDVVFMDVQMPEVDGLEATRRICSASGPENRPRIIGMTADAGEEDRRRCLEAGMDECIGKPVGRVQLASLLSSCRRRPA